ncbi:MAG: carboxypeptidase-like regulatory domain-containing protein [Bacteroidota bacterium]|nr:carboxypeptidase-like regulatory domain-containing protein [Bacteroidota bacterium]
MSAKRKHRTTDEYLKYLKGELSREERYSFERDLEADQFEMEAMEGMEQATPGELEEDLLTIHATLNKRLRRRRRRTVYSIAAGIASILIVGTVFLNIYEINPKTASESIPMDESFLQEDAIAPEDLKEEQDKTHEAAQVQEEARPQKMVHVQEPVPALEEARGREEIVVQKEEVLYAAEPPGEEVLDDVIVSEEMEAPAPVATEVLVVEAQPKRSQKKERTPDAAMAYSANRVSGIVVSAEDQEPLPGASILVKGRDSGMVADMDGRFSLVADQQDQTTVIASFVGMETDEYQLTGGKENRVVMQPDRTTLNEVVILEYEFNYSGAKPEGGLEAFKMYIEEQIRFPAGDSTSKREVVVLKFTVMKDGTISNFQTLRSPGDSFTEEALRLLQEGPVWNPARDESGITEDVVRMRIVFKRQ